MSALFRALIFCGLFFSSNAFADEMQALKIIKVTRY
jgi:hypothetical protein